MLNKKLLGSVSAPPAEYVEDVFSTWLYTGNDATQTINNGIDLAGKGGLVWIKARNDTQSNLLFDTNRGTNSILQSNSTSGANTGNDFINSFNLNGFTVGINANFIPNIFASWTFRKAAKFFDVVTYTGNGATPRNISHNLGSTPGMIIIKRTSTSGSSWWTWHRSISTGDLSGNNLLQLNTTDAQTNIGTLIGTANSTTFQIGDDSSVNLNGGTYVAYLFAHNAGGFGTAGTDNVISCGSFTTDGSGNATVNLGYEPQYILFKYTTTSPWYVFDVMRGFSLTAQTALFPNTSWAENNYTGTGIFPTATGFSTLGTSIFDPNATLIYMAIRRPMKVPTTGTSVFAPVAYTGTGSTRDITGVGFTLDANIVMNRADRTYNLFSTRLQGLSANGTITTPSLASNTTDAQLAVANSINGTSSSAMNGYTLYGGYSQMNSSFTDYISYNFARRPGFFDVVCYTGTGTAGQTFAHNLTVVPELMIVKSRSFSSNWQVYSAATTATQYLELNTTSSATTVSTRWNNTAPTSSVFTVGTSGGVNNNGSTYVSYLFASCPGVSKVGSYTGTGSTQTINCGFTGGARFVLIKRTDSTGDWYVWDTARGIVSGNDPYLLLNSTAAEVTSTDYIDPVSSGFEISSTAPAAINANGGSFIFMAIA